MIDPSEKEITTKEMLDTLEHCRVNMALGVVQAYAGKWTERDERTIDAIRRLIRKHGDLLQKVEDWIHKQIDLIDLLNEIRDFDLGKEKT